MTSDAFAGVPTGGAAAVPRRAPPGLPAGSQDRVPHRAAPAVQSGVRAHVLLRGVCRRQRCLRIPGRPGAGHLRLAGSAGLWPKVVI